MLCHRNRSKPRHGTRIAGAQRAEIGKPLSFGMTATTPSTRKGSKQRRIKSKSSAIHATICPPVPVFAVTVFESCMIYPGAISKETRLACCSVLDSDFRLRTKAAFERIAEQAYLFLNELVTSSPDWHGTGVATGGPNRRVRKIRAASCTGCRFYGGNHSELRQQK
jgi:hypothetical protein